MPARGSHWEESQWTFQPVELYGTCSWDKIFRIKFLLRRYKHLSTHEESRSRDMSEGLVSASFSYVCTCNFVAPTRLCYTSPLHAALCVQNANLSPLRVPATRDVTSHVGQPLESSKKGIYYTLHEVITQKMAQQEWTAIIYLNIRNLKILQVFGGNNNWICALKPNYLCSYKLVPDRWQWNWTDFNFSF